MPNQPQESFGVTDCRDDRDRAAVARQRARHGVWRPGGSLDRHLCWRCGDAPCPAHRGHRLHGRPALHGAGPRRRGADPQGSRQPGLRHLDGGRRASEAENPLSGERRHTATAYLTFVSIDAKATGGRAAADP